MAANVESMFYTRETPWHGLGTKVEESPCSEEALITAGLDWDVVQEPIYTGNEELINGYKANIRDTDRKVLGVVTNRYKVVQNRDAFSFTDRLLGEGVRYETAGSLQGGRRVWLLAHMPRDYIISGEKFSPYLLFSNTHDGSGAVKVALTPIRVVCQTLLVHDAHRKHQRKNQGGRTDAADGRSLYGQSGPGIRDTAENKAHRQSRQRLHRNPPALRRRLRTPADQKHQASAGGYETPVFRCPGPAGRG